ncbi:MAG: hypothetical protein ABR592_09820 [Nitriliruptorales bacterium]
MNAELLAWLGVAGAVLGLLATVFMTRIGFGIWQELRRMRETGVRPASGAPHDGDHSSSRR